MGSVPLHHGFQLRTPGERSALRRQRAKPDCHRSAADHKFEHRRSLWKPAVGERVPGDWQRGPARLRFPRDLGAFGIANKTELRLEFPEYFQNDNTGSGFASGLDDLSLGFKQQLGPTRGGFDVSVIPSVSFPTGAKAISSHGYDPTVQVPWSHSFKKNWTAAGMFSLMWPTQGPRRNLTGQASVYVDRQLTQPWDAYVEYSRAFPQRGGPQHVIDFGTAYKLSPHQQLDFHWTFGLSSAVPDHSIGFGYSFRLQAIHSK
jgi:hypothetical protein